MKSDLKSGARGLLAIVLLAVSGMAHAARADDDRGQPDPTLAVGAAEVRVVTRLGAIEPIGSALPAPRALPPLAPVYPQSFKMFGTDRPDAQPPQAFIVAPASEPETALPGDCVGGANAGKPCASNASCAGGGSCNFYRSELYRNESASGFTSGSLPRTVLDDVTLGGALVTPPARISSVEMGFVVDSTGIPAGSAMRVVISFWDTLNAAASPMNTRLLQSVLFSIPGPVAAGAYTTTITIPPTLPVAPSDPAIGVQMDFVDNAASNPFAFATVLFSNGAGTAPQTGASTTNYWRDANGNAQFDSSDARSFVAPNIANFYLHLGGEYPTAETEPNNGQTSPSVTVSCLSLGASINPVGDADWYRFTLGSARTLVLETTCGSALNNTTLTLRDSTGAQIDFNDDADMANLCSRITRTLAAGTYFLEVHEKGNDATIASYSMGVGPPPGFVTQLKMGAACSGGCTDKHTITWNPIAGGAPYDIIYGDLQVLHAAGLGASESGCLGDNLAQPMADDVDTPAPDSGFYYLARSRNLCTAGQGTYDSGGAGQVAPRDSRIPPVPMDCSRP